MARDHSGPPDPAAEMELIRTRFIAGLIGPVLLAIGISMILNRELANEIAAEVSRDKVLILISGLLLLVAGLAIVQLHDTWNGWPAIVTLIGWMSVVSGLARVLFPFQLAEMAPKFSDGMVPLAAAVLCAAAGTFLTIKAYFS